MIALDWWDLLKVPGTWLFYYVFIHILYYGLGQFMLQVGKLKDSSAETFKISEPDKKKAT